MDGVTTPGPGRPRDRSIDGAVLEVARAQLARRGYEAMSVASVATEAGTTRQAVYRRFSSKADLATAAIASMAGADRPPVTDDPFGDLVAELEAFARGVGRPGGISLVGSMLQEGADAELRAFYVDRVVRPRRERIAAILRRARGADLLEDLDEADIALAAAACTGTRYGLALADVPPGDDWARRTAGLVWRGLGGRPRR